MPHQLPIALSVTIIAIVVSWTIGYRRGKKQHQDSGLGNPIPYNLLHAHEEIMGVHMTTIWCDYVGGETTFATLAVSDNGKVLYYFDAPFRTSGRFYLYVDPGSHMPSVWQAQEEAVRQTLA